MSFLMLVAGLALLVITGDYFIRGAVALAVRLAIPMMVIGLTVVAFGTSAPELVVSVEAALSGAPGIAVGNVVGSNITNILLVLGLPALIAATDCDQPFIRSNLLYVLGASLLFIAFAQSGELTFWHGAVMFALLLAFLLVSAYRSHKFGKCDTATREAEELAEEHLLPWKTILFLVIGVVGLPIGAHMTVLGAADLARQIGVSDATIGLTIVALGTSLPELTTTMMAAVKGRCGLALGNVLGSNLFNILAIMGITSMVTPVPIPEFFLRFDLWIMLAAIIAITPFVLGRLRINRGSGLALVTGYLCYLVFAYSPLPQPILATAPDGPDGPTLNRAGAADFVLEVNTGEK